MLIDPMETQLPADPVQAIERPQVVTQSLLYLDGVSVSFDGFRAINNLSLIIAPGEMRAIIGPNGAGKTTMMDVITGKTKPDDRRRHVRRPGPTLPSSTRRTSPRLGIGRKFQKPTVFEMPHGGDNLELALKGPRTASASSCSRPLRRPRSGPARRDPRPSSASTTSSTCWRPAELTARSSGWRSACCWPRTRSSCSSTSRWPA
jgi:urea transport system ATP-binding protein